MLNTTTYQRNTNQSYNEVSPHIIRMAVIKKSMNNKCWKLCGEKGTLLHCQWECNLVQLLWRTIWRFAKKLKIELPNEPAIPLLSIFMEKTITEKDILIPMLTAARTWKEPKCSSTEEWIRRCGTYIPMEYYSDIKVTKLCHLHRCGQTQRFSYRVK